MKKTNRQSIDNFSRRHIGPRLADQQDILDYLGFDSLEALADKIVPKDIQREQAMAIAEGKSEVEALAELRKMADKNQVKRSLIGMSYYDTHTPNVIARNIFVGRSFCRR